MNVTEVTDGIFRLSANVDNIRFEGLWPVPHGVSINSYIVKGEKTAIIDGVCGWDGVPETLYDQLALMDITPDSIDYVIINHMEPDHSGWLESFLKIRPDFTVICPDKAVPLLEAFFDLTLNIRVVKPGDTLDLGNGRVLAFEYIPNVHWPETMATFDTGSGTLFSCDAFGSFGKITDAPYDDQLSPEEMEFFEKEAIRYYSNIVAAFSIPVQKAIEKCAALPIRIVAPGHGIVWRKNPQKIIDDYQRYASWSKGPAREEITLIWGSMYENTGLAVVPVAEAMRKEGITVHVHRVPETDTGDILASIWSSSAVVLGMPTYEYKMFPPMAAVLDELGKKRVQNRTLLHFGSYGWSGGAKKELLEIIERHKMNWEMVFSHEFKGRPKEADIVLLTQKAAEMARLVRRMVQENEVKEQP